jgi:hypothetical protein
MDDGVIVPDGFVVASVNPYCGEVKDIVDAVQV